MTLITRPIWTWRKVILFNNAFFIIGFFSTNSQQLLSSYQWNEQGHAPGWQQYTPYFMIWTAVLETFHWNMSRGMRFPTMWYVRPSKAQTSLHICADWSEPLLVAWIFYDSLATDWTSFRVSKPKRRLHRLVWVYIWQNTTLLEITCHGSYSIANLVVACGCILVYTLPLSSVGMLYTKESMVVQPICLKSQLIPKQTFVWLSNHC